MLLLENDSSAINHRKLKVLVNIQGSHTSTDFEVWNRGRYDIIVGMSWMCHIACKKCALYGKHLDGKTFIIKDAYAFSFENEKANYELSRNIFDTCDGISL